MLPLTAPLVADTVVLPTPVAVARPIEPAALLIVAAFGLTAALILCGLVWNGTGALVLGVIGTVAWDWMPALLAGSIIGGYLGSHLAIRKGNLWIKRSFEIVTILIGLKLIFG